MDRPLELEDPAGTRWVPIVEVNVVVGMILEAKSTVVLETVLPYGVLNPKPTMGCTVTGFFKYYKYFDLV